MFKKLDLIIISLLLILFCTNSKIAIAIAIAIAEQTTPSPSPSPSPSPTPTPTPSPSPTPSPTPAPSTSQINLDDFNPAIIQRPDSIIQVNFGEIPGLIAQTAPPVPTPPVPTPPVPTPTPTPVPTPVPTPLPPTPIPPQPPQINIDDFNPAVIQRPDSILQINLGEIPGQVEVIDTVSEVQEVLTALEEDTKNEHGEPEKPAIVYLSFTPKGYQPPNLDTDISKRELAITQEFSKVGITKPGVPATINIEPQDDDILDILIITAKGEPVRVTVPVTRKEVVQNAENLWIAVSDVFALNDSYKSSASNLYSWIINPIEAELEKREISNLLFILPADIRFIPVAALYDEQEEKFLVEKYSSGLAPSLNLNNNDYRSVRDMSLLAMGASNFADPNVVPLPAAGLELPTIKEVWNDEQINDFQPYSNENFNFNKIRANVANKPYGIIHFGTHGEFNPDNIGESYIQLYNSRLGLDDIRELGFQEPLVELMVLSACETAFGDEIAELGFAGLAVKAGVKTAMGSVWQVSDTGTLALMTDFYKQLKIEPTKAQALRQAQLSMLYNKVYKTEDGSAIVTPDKNISLEELPKESRLAEDFSHPFYWAPFTMIGNPW